MNDTELKKFLRFCVVGTAGFCTDAGILQLVLTVTVLGPIPARIPAFMVAVLVTWYFNRGFTFRMHHKRFLESFPPYIASSAIGLALNFGIYSAGVLFVPVLAKWPVLAVAIGSVTALFFNFAAARLFIFRHHDPS